MIKRLNVHLFPYKSIVGRQTRQFSNEKHNQQRIDVCVNGSVLCVKRTNVTKN